MADNGPVNITINGKEISAPPDRLLIDVAEEHDFFVPRFCYHPGLESVAACRMCLVEIEGSRRSLDPACSTPIADGMVVRTDSPSAVDAQEAVLELLLINHPLDCPICDRGGECPLQDQALRFGPGSSRYRDEKRHFPKPIPISDLVMLDRERCVLCWRCVRFCEEVSGDTFIDLMDRGSLTQINIAEDAPFDSYFSGNTIQICPVGALTSKPYRFLSRPWDIIPTETTCSFCAVGCPISLESRGGEVLRAQALPNEEVNSFWNCDKGRFGHRYVSHPDRLKAPLIRRISASGDAEFAEQNWDDALDLIAERIRSTLSESGPRSVGFIGGSHATNEDLFAASRFFREVIGTPNLDFRTFDADFPYEELAVDGIAGSNATLTDLEKARAILWVGPDPKEELPVLYLRLRKAALDGVKLVVVSSRCTSLDRLGILLSAAPGGEGLLLDDLARGSSSYEGDLGALEEAQQALSEGPIVICVGPQFVGRPARHLVPHLRSLIATLPDAKLFLCPPNANSQGALDMGISPYLAPGHREGPEGLGTRQMLEAAAQGDLKLLWVMGADLVTDFPDSVLVERALASGAFVVVSELFPTDTARSADVVLPAAAFAEKEGSFTNFERRIQKVNPGVSPPGVARADWQIMSALARRFGRDWGWTTAADAAAEIAASLPTHAAFNWDRLEGPPTSMREAVSWPPQLGHASGESVYPVARQVEEARPATGRNKPGPEGAWPLRWELRAVDATRRSGWVWDGAGKVPRFEPRAEGGVDGRSSGRFPLDLLLGRALYDNGQMVQRSEELRSMTPQPFVELHPDEARARGLASGEEVSVSSPRTSVSVRLRISEDTPPGAAFMLYDQPGLSANVLLDSSDPFPTVEVSR